MWKESQNQLSNYLKRKNWGQTHDAQQVSSLNLVMGKNPVLLDRSQGTGPRQIKILGVLIDRPAGQVGSMWVQHATH